MKNREIKFDTAELLRLIHERVGLSRFALSMNITEKRLARLLFGLDQFTHSEMLLAAKLLHLTNDEFLRCFFMSYSSENLNLKEE